MSLNPFVLICPATRGLGLSLTRHYLRTTTLPIYATHRSSSPSSVKRHVLSHVTDVDPDRLHLLHLDLSSEQSIASAASTLHESLAGKNSYAHRAWFAGGILHPEKRWDDLDVDKIKETFNINVISHLLLIKHFSRFLPPRASPSPSAASLPAKWIHLSARVGSISDNNTVGGWPSYRASKSALNQVIKTFDLNLVSRKIPAMSVGIHPGTVHTDLDGGLFWKNADPSKGRFEVDDAVEKITGVVEGLGEEARGRVWDWKGEVIEW